MGVGEIGIGPKILLNKETKIIIYLYGKNHLIIFYIIWPRKRKIEEEQE